MPNFATYDVVSDAKILLGATGTTIHDFDLGFAPSVNFGIRSVLSYMVDPGSAAGVTFRMSITNLLSDGSQEFKVILPDTALPSAAAFLRQEVIDANTFKKVNVTGLGTHKLRIQVTAGAAYFSDIVHLYQAAT